MTLRLLAALTALSACPAFAQVYWGSRSAPSQAEDIWCVAFANDTFAATTSQGNVLTSPDGLSWKSTPASPGTVLTSIAYGQGQWVAVGSGGTILVSGDLATWTKVVSPTSSKLNGVAFVDEGPQLDFFVAVGDNGTILTTNNVQSWTTVPSGVTGFLHGISYSINYVLVTGQGGVLLRGYEGTAFAPVTSGTSANLESALRLPSQRCIVVGSGGTAIHDSPFSGSLAELADPFDGWQSSASTGSTATFRGLAYGNGTVVAAGEQGTILTSPDGTTWTQRFSGDGPSSLSSATLLGAAFSPTLQRFVVVGTGGTILTSDAPPTVFANVSTRGTVSTTQTLIGGFVVEGSAPRTVRVRADGPSLSSFSVANPLPDPVLTVYDSNQNIVASNAGWTSGTNASSLALAALRVGAFALPATGKDSALLLTLGPGAYTAIITSAGGNSGTALFEAYTY